MIYSEIYAFKYSDLVNTASLGFQGSPKDCFSLAPCLSSRKGNDVIKTKQWILAFLIMRLRKGSETQVSLSHLTSHISSIVMSSEAMG